MPTRKTAHRKPAPSNGKSDADAPDKGQAARSTVWKGFVSFGLVSFPVRLFSAARAQAVHFHMLHKKDLSRVKEVWYCALEDKPIERADIVKGYEAAKGEYVVIDDQELKQIAPPTSSTMEIVQFVASGEVDPVFLESSYYVAPGEQGIKPYTLFLAALKQTGQDAIAKLSMHNREHVVLLRPDQGTLVLHTLFYPDELNRSNRGEAPKITYTSAELDLAKRLISRLGAPFKPEQFHDSYRENVHRLIREKKNGQKITLPEQTRKAPVIDLMDALKRSLAAGKESKARKTSRQSKAA